MAFSNDEVLAGLAELITDETGISADEVALEKSFTDAAANTDTSYIGPYFNVGVRLGIGVASTVGYALLDELRLCVTPPPPGTVVVVR